MSTRRVFEGAAGEDDGATLSIGQAHIVMSRPQVLI